MSEKNTIFIKSTLRQNEDKSWPLALYDKDPQHPVQHYGKNAGDVAGQEIEGSAGELYVTGNHVFEAAKTPAVIAAIREGKVAEVDADGNVINGPSTTEPSVPAAVGTGAPPDGAPSGNQPVVSAGGGLQQPQSPPQAPAPPATTPDSK